MVLFILTMVILFIHQKLHQLLTVAVSGLAYVCARYPRRPGTCGASDGETAPNQRINKE